MIRLDARKPLTAGAPAVPPPDDGATDYAALIPLGLWGGAAAAGLLVLAIAAWTETGQARLAGAYAALTGNTEAENRWAAERARQLEEARQTAEIIRNLTRDRDRLLVRVTALERNYEDVTGSIGKLAHAGKPPAASAAVSAAIDASGPPVMPAPAASAPATTPPAPAVATEPATTTPPVASPPVQSPPVSSLPTATPAPSPVASAPATIPAAPRAAPQPAAPAPVAANPPEPEPQEPISGKGEFGVDIGGAPSLAAMRTAWDRIRRNHAKLLDGLQPLIAIRDGRGGQAELRLVVGPIGTPAAAARLCSSLAAAGLSCQPTQFEGQRLAQR
jgi:hypothetical protein